jgi:hypothetical protein
MRVLTDQKCELQVQKMLEQAFVPARRTLGTRWIITATLSSPGITKSHGKNRDLSFIEEGRTIQPQPVTQAVAACVIPRYTAPMDLATWRLTDDQQPSGARQLHHGARTERQFCLTDPTSTNVAQYAFQRHLEALCINKYRSHPYRAFCQSMMSSSLVDIAISQAQETYATAKLDCFACLKNSSV